MEDLELYLNDRIKLKAFKENLSNERALKEKLTDKIKNTPSYSRPDKDNSLTEETFNKTLKIEQDALEKNEFILKPNYITTERHSCLTNIKNLKEITLKQMMVNKIHYGNFIECTTIAAPYYVCGLNLLVKDNNGDIENLVVYNFETKSYYVDPEMIIPIGTKLIIKEPHLQLLGLEENDFGIRVDSPTDVIIKSYPDCDSNKSVDQLIEEGTCSFDKSHFHVAIRRFSEAIEKSNKTNSKAYLYRSRSYLGLEKYYAAHQDAVNAVKLDKKNSSAHFYSGQAAYLLGKFEEALKCFETSLKLNPSSKETEIELNKTKERIQESKKGTYDFNSLYEQFFTRKNLYMDVADYRSDKIQITDIENKSKGVVATDFIKKGTLLLANKAASAAFHNKIDYRKKSFAVVNCLEKSSNTRNESENISNLIYKMQDNPELADKIYSLYGGPDYDRESLGDHPLIDVKRIEQIYRFNSFQIENSFEELEIMALDDEIKKFKIYEGNNYAEFDEDYELADVDEDIREIDVAAVKFESNVYRNLADLHVKLDNLDKQSGLFIGSSFFNHSCVSNSSVRTVGDFQMFYTHKDIQKGEECTIRYFPPEWSYQDKIERTLDIYGFACDCNLCKLDANDPLTKIRAQLIEQIEYKHMNRMITIPEAFTDVQKMKATYANRELKFQLIIPLQFLANKYRELFKYKQSAKCFEEMFDLIKDYNDFGAIALLKEIYSDYQNCSMTEESGKCKSTAFDYFDSMNLNKKFYERLWDKMVESCDSNVESWAINDVD